MDLSLRKAFSMVRDGAANQANREAVGGYIYGRMGRAGLVTRMQVFVFVFNRHILYVLGTSDMF